MPRGCEPRVPMETAGRAGAALGMEEPGGGAEPRWLRAARAFVCETLCPAGPGGGGPEQLADSVLRCLRSTWGGRSGEFPLGYSFISISDLQCQQRTPCCSHMTWSTREFKEWAHQDKVILPKQSVLPRAHLILIGYLTDGRRQDGKEKLMDGNLYVQDNTGSMPCELLHFDFEWLELLFLFPSWAYIPHTSQSSSGYVEILADPVPVDPRPERVVNAIPVFYPATAAQLLSTRGEYKKRIKLNVAGELARLSTLLYIHHKTFFFLFLKCFSSVSCVPVLVQKPPQLAWHHMLQLGHGYVLTALSVSSLKASGRKVFVTSFSSCLLPYSAEQVKEQTLEIAWHGGPLQTVSPEASVQLSSPLELTDEKLPVLVKESKILSYVGTITRVLNAQAGLYELDNKVCLCLAYQQQLNSARGLRPGACVELQDVHLLQKPLASFPFVVILGACLHSTVVLKGFSRLSTFHQPVVSSRNLYMQLLFRFNLGLPLYLWLVSLLEMLEQRFCSFFGRRRLFICSGPQRPGIAEKFLVPILKAVVPSKERVRDVHREILADMHHCPLQQYQPLEPPCQAPPLSLLCSVAEQRSWEAFNPSQLLSHVEAQHMGTQELNRRLAWSYNAFSAESFQPRMVLLGVLRASSGSGSLQLQDKSDLLPCVISHRDGSPFTDTALIGSLLQVEAYQLVVERFLQSDFPSWEQLLTPEHVRGKETRLYVQFCFEDVQILHMPERHVQEGPTSSDSPLLGKKDGQCPEAELGSPEAKVPKLERTSPGAGTAECCDRGQSSARGTSCMSRLFLVTQKEGLMSRNYLPAAEGDGEGQDLQLSFQATVLWMSKPQLWRHPREIGNLPELEQTNKDSKAQQRALLLFMGRSLRWFPFLHPDGLYRLIVPQCLDVGVFEQTGLSPLQGRLLNQSGCPSYLLVSDTWRLQHETWLTCLAQPQVMPESVCPIPASTVFSIPELLSNSFTGSLVSFSGAIVERTLCASPGNEKFSTPCDMRRQKGTLLCWDHSVKLSVSAAPGSSAVLDVYIAGAYLQHLWGLLPGAKILFQNLQRKISRFHNVYCTYIASSCISILALPPSCLLLSSSPAGTAFKSPAATSPTLVVLSKLLLQPHSLSQGQILCHLSCVLDLSMQWICSDCSSIFREGRCSRHSPPCPSHTGVSKAFARILVEDGTGEALVLCRNQQVAALLGLSPAEWNAVQSNVQSRGSILIQHGGVSARPWCVEEPEDLVTCYLRNLCRSRAISQPMLLDFSLDRKPSKIPQPDSSQPRRFLSGEVEYISRVGARLNLMCLNIQEADPKVLCGLTSKRIKTWISHSA